MFIVLAVDPAVGHPVPVEWTRVGDLGPVPQQVHPELPLSDQENRGHWVLDPIFCDDFKGTSLDSARWHLAPTAPEDWTGRQPALFLPANVTVADGALNITARKGDVPEMAKYPGRGYAGYTTAFVNSQAFSGYGYYEIKARPMNSAFSSAFWLTSHTGNEENGSEIDIFEIGAKAHGREYDDNMHAHVWNTPQDKNNHWAVGSLWRAPWKLGDDFHVYGFEWNKDELLWYVDGVLVRKQQNTNWFFPLRIIFDSEAMLSWFGAPNDADFPSTFSVKYLRVWRSQAPESK